METTKCIEINVCVNKLTMTLLGNEDVKREDFLDESITYLFLNWFEHRMHPVLVLIREIIKNVFDHGTGKGVLYLEKEGEDYISEFIDSNPQNINFSEISGLIREGEWIKKSFSNFGVGLSMIRGISEDLESFSIDDSKGGINYSGKYKSKLN